MFAHAELSENVDAGPGFGTKLLTTASDFVGAGLVAYLNLQNQKQATQTQQAQVEIARAQAQQAAYGAYGQSAMAQLANSNTLMYVAAAAGIVGLIWYFRR